MPGHMLASSAIVFLTIAADTTDYDVYASAGAPLARVDIVLTVNSGVVVYRTSANGALHMGSAGFAAGSTLKIVNNGTICGSGGAGGNGGAPLFGAGTNGGTGFNAIFAHSLANLAVTIDNTNGHIFGGGGGGGGGGGSPTGGGGGGGGRGRAGGVHGVHGGTGSDGSDGSFSAAGLGGLLGAGHGGDGGDWGQPGNDGLAAGGAQGTGGTAGNALDKGTTSVTWVGGNNSTQVKGPIV